MPRLLQTQTPSITLHIYPRRYIWNLKIGFFAVITRLPEHLFPKSEVTWTLRDATDIDVPLSTVLKLLYCFSQLASTGRVNVCSQSVNEGAAENTGTRRPDLVFHPQLWLTHIINYGSRAHSAFGLSFNSFACSLYLYAGSGERHDILNRSPANHRRTRLTRRFKPKGNLDCPVHFNGMLLEWEFIWTKTLVDRTEDQTADQRDVRQQLEHWKSWTKLWSSFTACLFTWH